MNVARLKVPTMILAVVALVIGVSSGAVAAKLITSADVKNGSLKSEDIKNGTLGTKDLKQNGINGNRLAKGTVNGAKLQGGTVSGGKLQSGAVGTGQLANGSVTADKLAPGAVAFPQTLWGPVIRNQEGAGQSTLVTGPAGSGLKGTGSLELSVTGAADLAAFGDSVDFAGVTLDSITNLSYWSFNNDATPLVRPSLRMEINPHLVPDATPGGVLEFSTLIYEPAAGAQGWVQHANIQADKLWRLTGDDATTTGCAQATPCTFAEVLTALNGNDGDDVQPAISSGVYFGLGKGVTAPTETNVDNFVFNNFQFDFEPSGVFLTTPPAP